MCIDFDWGEYVSSIMEVGLVGGEIVVLGMKESNKLVRYCIG